MSMPADMTVSVSPIRGRWTAIRDNSVWVAGLFLSVGLTVMWVANLSNLATKGGFTGISGWLIPGIVVVMMRGWYLSRRLVKEWNQLAWRERLRLLIPQLLPTFANLLANVAAIGLIVHNLSVGQLKWGRWDWWCAGVAVGTAVIMVTLKLWFRQRMSSKLYVAGMALGTRAFQQGMLVKSPQLKLIPWGTPVGLLAIAALQFSMSFIEFKAAKEERSVAGQEALLVAWADGSNLVAAVILMIGWSLVTTLFLS